MFSNPEFIKQYINSINNNVLPITSNCQARCIFCSHYSNPGGINIFYPRNIPISFIREYIEFLDRDKPIVIGESATLISEGESMVHPDFKEIMIIIREYFPETIIHITTNGGFLDYKMLEFLNELSPIEITISLNSLNYHRDIMGFEFKMDIRDIISYFIEHNIYLEISFVYLHEYRNNLINEIELLINIGAYFFRILKPGYSKYSKRIFKWPDYNFYKRIEELRQHAVILIEPPELEDLRSVIVGIIPHSPAYKARLRFNDIIYSINSNKPLCRVDTFNKINKLENPELLIIRENKRFNVKLKKKKNEKSGIVMDFDILPDDLINIKHILKKNEYIATAILPASFLKKIFPEKSKYIIEVPCHFFGGNIQVAGLLTYNDINRVVSNKKVHIPKNLFKIS